MRSRLMRHAMAACRPFWCLIVHRLLDPLPVGLARLWPVSSVCWSSYSGVRSVEVGDMGGIIQQRHINCVATTAAVGLS